MLGDKKLQAIKEVEKVLPLEKVNSWIKLINFKERITN